jgi:hypothetical protein
LKSDSFLVSPPLGLLCTCIPQLVANLTTNQSCSTASLFVKELFHQRIDKVTNRRYGPISPINSRSNPAYWLSVQNLGVIFGIAISERAINVFIFIYKIIFCNMYFTQWSGTIP